MLSKITVHAVEHRDEGEGEGARWGYHIAEQEHDEVKTNE